MVALVSGPTVRVVTESVGDEVDRRLGRMGLEYQDFAVRAGVHVNTLRKIRKGDPSVEPFTVARVLRVIEELEREMGLTEPEKVVNVIELPDGTRVLFEGSSEGVAEAARRFLRDRGESTD